MRIKQKWVAGLLSVFLILVGSMTLPLLAPSDTAYADYNPDASGKCQDGSGARSRTNRETRATERYCPDSTKRDTPQQNPSTPTPPATDPNTDAGTAKTDEVDSDDANSVTCAVEKIGWILCPVMEGAAKISDKAFDILADNFLRTDPELIRDDSGTKIGWEVARNLANIMFIIAFLIIIFSQVTGRGLNNYGIKKMLPRLIVAAILVNLSYYICQLVVDGTNILGYEIQNAMAQIANTVGPSVFGNVERADTETASGLAPLSNGGILAMTVTLGLASAAVVWFLLPTMAALIPLILITVATIIIVLLLRKAFIVLLIVLSPIAFVMYLLPNTEKYFDKWRNMFTQLLLVFPIVGLLFGAGQLASTIILVAGSDNGQAAAAESCNPDDEGARSAFNKDKSANDNALCGEPSVTVQGGKNSNNECFAGNTCKATEPYNATITTGLVATGIAVAPLLAVWAVLKGALAAAGAIGGKISGAVERGVRGGVNGGVGGGKKAWEQSAFGRGQAIRKAAKAGYKNRRFAERLNGEGDPNGGLGDRYKHARSRYTQIAAGGLPGALPDNLRTGAMGAQADALRRNALAQSRQAESEDIKNARFEVDQMDLTGVIGELFDSSGNLNKGVDANSARTAALIQRAMEAGSAKEKAAIIDAFRQGGNTLASRTTGASLAANNPGYYGAAAVDAISRGAAVGDSMSASNLALEGLRGNKFTAEKMASANKEDTQWAHDIAVAAGDAQAIANNKKNAVEALTSANTKGRVGSQKSALMDMARRP